MAETIRGKGVISGIAVGQVMLAGQNLDGYLAAYHMAPVRNYFDQGMTVHVPGGVD